MINSHKELVDELVVFGTKMPLINEFHYLKDVELIQEEVAKSSPRVFLLGLEGIGFDDENYNMVITYRFLFADETLYENDAIVTSETENIFCVSALGDFLRYVNDTPVEFGGVSTTTESTAEKTYTTISGTFDFIVKRSPTFWTDLGSLE